MDCAECKKLEARRYACIKRYARAMEVVRVLAREPALVVSAERDLDAAWNRLEKHRKTHALEWDILKALH